MFSGSGHFSLLNLTPHPSYRLLTRVLVYVDRYTIYRVYRYTVYNSHDPWYTVYVNHNFSSYTNTLLLTNSDIKMHFSDEIIKKMHLSFSDISCNFVGYLSILFVGHLGIDPNKFLLELSFKKN